MTHSRVRFLEGPGKVLSYLEVHSVRRPDLVPLLVETLLNMRVQLVRFATQVLGDEVRAQLVISK